MAAQQDQTSAGELEPQYDQLLALSLDSPTSHLRVRGGDVVLQLSGEEQDTLLLHSKFLVQHSDWFKASLNLKWHKPQIRKGATIPSWHYGLVFDASMLTWTLQSMPMDLANEDGEKWFGLPKSRRLPKLYSTRMASRPLDSASDRIEAQG